MSDEMILTGSESLTIHRRRLGYTQTEYAALIGEVFFTYCLMELGEKPIPFFEISQKDKTVNLELVLDPSASNDRLPHTVINVGTLQPHEKCVILRRRLGYTQKYIAKKLGISRSGVVARELGQGDCTQILRFLEQAHDASKARQFDSD